MKKNISVVALLIVGISSQCIAQSQITNQQSKSIKEVFIQNRGFKLVKNLPAKYEVYGAKKSFDLKKVEILERKLQGSQVTEIVILRNGNIIQNLYSPTIPPQPTTSSEFTDCVKGTRGDWGFISNCEKAYGHICSAELYSKIFH
jgi:hypothetical protein